MFKYQREKWYVHFKRMKANAIMKLGTEHISR